MASVSLIPLRTVMTEEREAQEQEQGEGEREGEKDSDSGLGDDPPRNPMNDQRPSLNGVGGVAPDDHSHPPAEGMSRGWTELSQASASVVGLSPEMPPHQGMSDERLRNMVQPNRDALQLARRGLDHLAQELSQGVPDAGPNRSETLKTLARLFLAEALVGERYGQNDTAIQATVDLIRLGTLGSHGGGMSDHHVGQTINGLGSHVLQRIQPKLTASQCKWSAQQLLRTDVHQESIQAAMERDFPLAIPSQGLGQRVRRTLFPARRSVPAAVEQQYRYLARRDQARLRLLILDLSLRAHDLERKRFPTRLEALVPDYLPYLPDDPFRADAAPPMYRLGSGETYLLYSLGPNGRDDGGALSRDPQSPQVDGDILLNPAATSARP